MVSAGAMEAVPFGYPVLGSPLAVPGDNGYDLPLPEIKAKDRSSVAQAPSSEMISIDPDSGVPIWLQLRNRFIFLIASGRYNPGDKLPTVRELAVELGVNYNTVGKVYQDIERDGYITTRRGKGTFVAERQTEEAKADLGEVEVLTDDYIRQCMELGVPLDDIAGLVARRVEGMNR